MMTRADSGRMLKSMAATRTDLAAGLVLFGCSYAAGWLIRRRPQTRVERLFFTSKSAGRAATTATAGLLRIALGEAERAARARREAPGSRL